MGRGRAFQDSERGGERMGVVAWNKDPLDPRNVRLLGSSDAQHHRFTQQIRL